MIFHLQSTGVPILWRIISVYKDSFGMACSAATSWLRDHPLSAREVLHGMLPNPHFVVELVGIDGVWQAQRSQLLMDDGHLQQQKPDTRRDILQAHSAPFPLDESLHQALSTALTDALRERAYLIPRDVWEQRYPAALLMEQRFRAFREAHQTHRDSGAASDMPFALEHAMFMEAPADFVFPYSVSDQRPWAVLKDGEAIADLTPTTEEDAKTMARLLNSGFNLEDIPVLLAGDRPFAI